MAFRRLALLAPQIVQRYSRNISDIPLRATVPCSATQKNSFFTSSAQNVKETMAEADIGAGSSTLNQDEVDKFRELAAQWWNESGELKALHSLNSLRVPLIRDALQGKSVDPCGPFPLAGMTVIDVGCGGGILSEPLARLGAKVTGLDACIENIDIARCHAENDPELQGNLDYVCGTVEEHVEKGVTYDAVACSEVLEHVDNQDFFLETCVRLLKPGGSIFVTTLNRTAASHLGGIVAAEYILRLVPPGTHDWNKFVTPDELESMLDGHGCSVRLVHGMVYVPFLNKWKWFPNKSINYCVHAVKRL